MKWVGFIGPSGTGKTTFQNLVLKRRKSPENWVSVREGLEEIITSTSGGIRHKFGQLYFFQKIMNMYKDKYLYEMIHNINMQKHPSYHLFADRFLDFITSLDELSAPEKIQYINWYTHVIKTMIFFDIHDYQKLVIMDEGLYNNTPGLELMDWRKIQSYPHACVFFHLNVDANLEWIKKRKEKGTLRNIHKNLGDQDLLNYVQRDHYRFKAKRDFLKEKGIPFLDVHMEDHLLKNVERTFNFIDKLAV